MFRRESPGKILYTVIAHHVKPFRPVLPSRSPAQLPRHFSSSDRRLATDIPVIRTLSELRTWRKEARIRGLDVGVVPTMGALHQGHLDLVKRSLVDNPLTVMTLFVNPMQFAPTEDLSRYPRTLQKDLELLQTILPEPSPATNSSSSLDKSDIASLPNIETSLPRTTMQNPLVVFAPTEEIMYPLKGELQDLGKHKGVTVEMRGYGEVLEGVSRPQFFKGVATVCTKLFNAVEPDHAYFGQKDIQQALLLKIMLKDLLLAHPLPENLHILPTTRDPQTGLALSSRNAYLTPAEYPIAPVLYRALSAARALWERGGTTGEEMLEACEGVLREEQERLRREGSEVVLKGDYFEVFEKDSFEPLRGHVGREGREIVVVGAVWVGKTRLIDNLLLGWEVD